MSITAEKKNEKFWVIHIHVLARGPNLFAVDDSYL